MSYTTRGRYTSPYRSAGSASVHKDYGSPQRYGRDSRTSANLSHIDDGSTFSRIDQREVGSLSQRLEGGRRYSSIPDSDATVATNVLNGMIDKALDSPTVPAYRAASTSRAGRDYDSESYSRGNVGAEPYYRPRDSSVGSRHVRNSDSYSRSVPAPPPIKAREPLRPPPYRARDPSPGYYNSRDVASYPSNHYRNERDDRRPYDSDRTRREIDESTYSKASRSYAGGAERSVYTANRGTPTYEREYAENRNTRERPYESHGRDYAENRNTRERDYDSDGRSHLDSTGFRNTSRGRENYEERDFDSKGVGVSRHGERDYDDRSRVVHDRNFDHRTAAYEENRDRSTQRRGVHEHSNYQDDRGINEPPPQSHIRNDRRADRQTPMPPRSPTNTSRYQEGNTQNSHQYPPSGLQRVQSDLSNDTGAFPITSPIPATTRGIATDSVVSAAASVTSAWHNKDVVLLPKGQKVSEVAVAATAAASLILDENSVCGFDTAARSVSNLVQPGDQKNHIDTVIEPSVLGQIEEEHSHVPVSYEAVRAGMKRDLMTKASVSNTGTKQMGPLPMDAYQFWARCTLLVATAVLKTGQQNTQLAHAAAETVMMEGIATMHQEWLQTADQDLRKVADAVNEVLKDAPNGNANIASSTSVALVTDGTKALAMERARRSVPAPAYSSVVVEEVTESEDDAYVDSNGLENVTYDERSVSQFTANQQPPHNGLSSVLPNRKNKQEVDNPDSPTPPTDHVTQKRGVELHSIRSSGSLLDANPSSDDDKDDLLEPNTSFVPKSYETYKKDYLANAVTDLLLKPTEDGAPPPVQQKPSNNLQSSQKLRYQELEQRREEITQRIQRIQRRAAADRDMPVALEEIDIKKTKKTNSSDPHDTSPDSVPKMPSSRAASPRESKTILRVKHSKPPPASPRAKTTTKAKQKVKRQHEASIFNPVFQFIEKITCSMDTDADEDDSITRDEHDEDVKELIQPLPVTNEGDDRVSNEEQNRNEEDWKQFRATEAANLDKIGGSDDKEEAWETLDSLDSTDNALNRSVGGGNSVDGLSSQARTQKVPLVHNPRSQDSGAFSVAFGEKGLANIPMRRLSLTPSSPLTETLELETNNHLFFNGDISSSSPNQIPTSKGAIVNQNQEPSASDAYVNMTGKKTRQGASVVKVSKGEKKKNPFKNRFSRRK